MKDWKTVMQLGEQANAKNLHVVSGGEYLPFIEAFARTGQWPRPMTSASRLKKPQPASKCSFAKIGPDSNKSPAELDRDAYLAKAKTQFCVKIAKTPNQ